MAENSTLDGFTVTGGSAEDDYVGGGIANWGALTVTDSTAVTSPMTEMVDSDETRLPSALMN